MRSSLRHFARSYRQATICHRQFHGQCIFHLIESVSVSIGQVFDRTVSLLKSSEKESPYQVRSNTKVPIKAPVPNIHPFALAKTALALVGCRPDETPYT